MQERQTNYSFWGAFRLKHTLKTYEALRTATAEWLLLHSKEYICCYGNELGKELIDSFELPELEEELIETIVNEKEEITLVFQSRICLPAHKTVKGKASSFIILRYVRALYDDFGNIYRYITLGYKF